MPAHVHLSPIHILFSLLAMVAIFGTLHLLALALPSRVSNALLALGF